MAELTIDTARNAQKLIQSLNDAHRQNAHPNPHKATLAEILQCEQRSYAQAAEEFSRPYRERITELETLLSDLGVCLGADNAKASNRVDTALRLLRLQNNQFNDDQDATISQYEITIKQQREKIEELEKSVERKDAEHSITIEKAAEHANRAAELKKQIADGKRFTDEWHEAVDALCELWPEDEPIEANPPLGSWIRRLVALKEKRLAKQSAPLEVPKDAGQRFHELAETIYRRHGAGVFAFSFHEIDDSQRADCADAERMLRPTPPIVDGKTPGQVQWEFTESAASKANGTSAREWHAIGLIWQNIYEIGARAVLDTFGNQMARKALEGVRGQIAKDPYPDVRALRYIDTKLAELGTVQNADKTPTCFLCGKGPHDHAMMILESLPEQYEVKWCNGKRENFGETKPLWWNKPTSDHVHELGSCSRCDRSPPDTTTESGLPDAVLRAAERR